MPSVDPDAGDGRIRPAGAARAGATVTLGLVLACLAATLTLGAIHKAPCAGGDWGDGRQYRLLCYTDIVPLFGTEQLAGAGSPTSTTAPRRTTTATSTPS